jgi:uncharacterized protein YeaO (DUF488 family)
MTSGIRVEPLTAIAPADGVLFCIRGTKSLVSRRMRVLASLEPSASVARLARRTDAEYIEFRMRYWRELGTRSNVADLAKLRYLGKRSPGVTLLSLEPIVEWSAEAAVAELLDGANQRPPDWGNYSYIYAVELSPRRSSHKPEIYIGDTAKSPEQRFHDHVTDHRERRSGARTGAACVRHRGVRLAYELFKELNPLPRGMDACEAAKELRRRLEPRFEVCGSPECMGSRGLRRRVTLPST